MRGKKEIDSKLMEKAIYLFESDLSPYHGLMDEIRFVQEAEKIRADAKI